ncbi:Panacea domain-containing protein [Leptotrichia massiliensis]|uniref:Panacea domain-containing protein n=1 Tax=Leptotrichia massiliensis TaxID=1852388 RepID=UPI0008D8E706|nr:Panacea domain-containing protein [Leptotrichia massiliensis]
MENLLDVASYIYNRYKKENNKCIDEMKLHKLLYFSQRESFIQKNEALFEDIFYGWKFGPVLKKIREIYKNGKFLKKIPKDVEDRILPIMNEIFQNYSCKNSWSLSRLSHGEISWKNSRKGIDDEENGNCPIDINDIKKDANRIISRKKLLQDFKFL